MDSMIRGMISTVLLAAFLLTGTVVAPAGDDGATQNQEAEKEEPKREKKKEKFFPAPPGMKAERDIEYVDTGEHKLHLDVYGPEEPGEPLPLLIWIHGGAWRTGSKWNIRYPAVLLDYGYAVASVDYRLSGQASFPGPVQDIKAAISFMRVNAKRFNIDPDRIGIWGKSAGGHLAAVTGTSNGVEMFDFHPITKEASTDVQAVVTWSAPTDLLRMNDVPGALDHLHPKSAESKLIGGPILENKDKAIQANPITYVDKDDPPFLVVHGSYDKEVIPEQAKLLHEAQKKAGAESTLHIVKADHQVGGRPIRKGKPNWVMQQVIDFFDTHLKPAKSEAPGQ